MKQIFVDGHGQCEVWNLPKVAPKKQRRGKYIPESFVHPAKMNVGLCRKIIETYTKLGEIVLDPMSGIGTTLVEASLMGRNAIGVELEDKFVNTIQKNIELIERMRTMTPKGKAVIIQGDSKELSKILGEKADVAVFSPPYADKTIAKKFKSEEDLERFAREQWVYKHGRSLEATKRFIKKSWQGYPESRENIGNLKYGKPVDAIVTSPPFAQALRGGGIAQKGYDGPKHGPTDLVGKRSYMPENVGSNEGNISNMPYGEVDAISIKKVETYLSAMLKVYRECLEVLKPSGKMVLVIKNFIRNKKVVRLDLDTKRLCEAAGFRWVETKLFKLLSKSFWRIIYEQKYPEVDTSLLQYEFIEVFEKPDSFEV